MTSKIIQDGENAVKNDVKFQPKDENGIDMVSGNILNKIKTGSDSLNNPSVLTSEATSHNKDNTGSS